MSWWLEPVAEEAAHLVDTGKLRREKGTGKELPFKGFLSASDPLVLPRAQALKASC